MALAVVMTATTATTSVVLKSIRTKEKAEGKAGGSRKASRRVWPKKTDCRRACKTIGTERQAAARAAEACFAGRSPVQITGGKKGIESTVVGQYVVLLDRATKVVLDVIRGVLINSRPIELVTGG